LNYIEIDGERVWLFVAKKKKKMHEEEGELREGKRRVDRQVIN
jgi:hypothetical protein